MLKLKIIFATLLALIAFAANSVLCRLALGDDSIDAASFTVIRLISGALMLLLIVKSAGLKKQTFPPPNWKAATMLFVYAVCFSYAYISLETGTGALILFASVQLTMITGAYYLGEKLHFLEWIGLLVAFAGFVYLILPTISTPSVMGFILMAIAGVAWGIYTLAGRGVASALANTASNFLYTLPFVAVLLIVVWPDLQLTRQGFILAVLSGALASGLGYSIWYIALNGLSLTQAAVSQLSVPIIASIGGVVFAAEAISLRFIISCMIILGGILTVIIAKYFIVRKSEPSEI